MAKQQVSNNSFTIRMLIAKETKGALQYKEVNEKGAIVDFHEAKIGTLYIRKTSVSGFSKEPQAISVTVSA